jgi:hypothetical protein
VAKSSTKWLPIFKKYLANARIQSKHAEDDPEGKGIPLKLWASQARVMEGILEGLEDGVHVFYVLKSRQLGVTTITLLILVFWLALHPNTIGCLVSDSDKNASKNRSTLERYLTSLAPFMGKSFYKTRSNRHAMTFSNGSRLDFLVAGKTKVSWGEGEGYTVGHLTEVASYGKEEGLESFRHAMAPDNPRSLYIYESTAHGPNHWMDMWNAAIEDPFSSRAIFVGWWSHDLQKIPVSDRRYKMFGSEGPTRDEWELVQAVKNRYDFDISMEQLAWYRWDASRPNAGVSDRDQNQPWVPEQAFVYSGISFFSVRRVAARRDEIVAAPPVPVPGGYAFVGYAFYLGEEYHLSKVERLDPASSSMEAVKLRVWEPPDPEGVYAIGCDPAFGRSERSDNHAISVWRCYSNKLVQVAEWADNIPDTRNAAWVLAYLAGTYTNCRINIDMTGGPGQAVMQQLDDLRKLMRAEAYPNRPDNFEDFLGAANWYMYRRVDSPGPGFMYNSKIGRDLKLKMMNLLRDNWMSDLLEIRSVPLLDEMAVVRQQDADIGASASGRNRDDLTFAMALANITWIENVRQSAIVNNIAWDRDGVAKRESSSIEKLIGNRIYGILQAQAEMDDAPPAKSFWDQRGLLS